MPWYLGVAIIVFLVGMVFLGMWLNSDDDFDFPEGYDPHNPYNPFDDPFNDNGIF